MNIKDEVQNFFVKHVECGRCQGGKVPKLVSEVVRSKVRKQLSLCCDDDGRQIDIQMSGKQSVH